MANTPKPLRTAKAAGAARMRVANKLDNVKRGAAAPSAASVSRYKNDIAKTTKKILNSSPSQIVKRGDSAAGDKKIDKAIANVKGALKQTRKNQATLAKRSYVPKGNVTTKGK